MQVYLIQNMINGKCYIGQHSHDNLQKYFVYNASRALSGATGKRRLWSAIRKYGPKNFTIRCIHKCADKAEMDRAEKAYIKLFGTRDPELGYNLTDGGEGANGLRHSETFKAALRKPRTEELKAKVSAGLKRCFSTHENKAHLSRVFVTKSHCPKDHEYDTSNTYLRNGVKFCRACDAARKKAARDRKRLEGRSHETPNVT